MRPKLFLFACYALMFSVFVTHRAMAEIDGLIDIDEPFPNSQTSENSKPVDSSDGEGDDEDNYGSGVMSDESGSGSAEGTTDPSTVDVNVVSPTRREETVKTEAEMATTINNEIDESTDKPTEDSENVIPEEPIDGESDGNVFGGGVATGAATVFAVTEGTEKSPNAEARVDEKVLRVLTTEVIAAVVVGAVCAVILIAFLVYRLRKRDEGSYALSDGGYKDTPYKLQGDTGKEAFV